LVLVARAAMAAQPNQGLMEPLVVLAVVMPLEQIRRLPHLVRSRLARVALFLRLRRMAGREATHPLIRAESMSSVVEVVAVKDRLTPLQPASPALIQVPQHLLAALVQPVRRMLQAQAVAAQPVLVEPVKTAAGPVHSLTTPVVELVVAGLTVAHQQRAAVAPPITEPLAARVRLVRQAVLLSVPIRQATPDQTVPVVAVRVVSILFRTSR